MWPDKAHAAYTAVLADTMQQLEEEKKTSVSLQEQLNTKQPQFEGAIQLKQFVHEF